MAKLWQSGILNQGDFIQAPPFPTPLHCMKMKTATAAREGGGEAKKNNEKTAKQKTYSRHFVSVYRSVSVCVCREGCCADKTLHSFIHVDKIISYLNKMLS